MEKILIIALVLAGAAGCANSNETKKSPTTTNESQQKEREMKQKDWLTEFEKAFNKGDAKTIASLYTEDASWTLANGVLMEAKDLESGLNAAFKQGAGSLKISDREYFPVSEGELVRHQFSFKVGDFEIVGKRSIWTQKGMIIRDIWVPKAAADSPTTEKVKLAMASLDDAFNNAPKTAASTYLDKATLVLTTGKTIRDSAVQVFVLEAAPTVSQMHSELHSVYQVGKDHVVTESTFSAKLKMGEKIIPLAGNRLVLWKSVDGDFKIDSEFSWPAKKN